jgi:hypothetical protein
MTESTLFMKNLFLFVMVMVLGLVSTGCAQHKAELKQLFSLKVDKGNSPYVRTPPAPPMPTEASPSVTQVFVLAPNEGIPWSRVAPKPANRSGESVTYKGDVEMVQYYSVRGDQWVSEYLEVRKGRWVKVVVVTTTLTWSYGEWRARVVPIPPQMYYPSPVPPKGQHHDGRRH